MLDFKDQVIVITGGAGNLGAAVTRAFYLAGARVAVVDRVRDMAVEIFGDEIPEGEYCLYVSGNLMDESSVAEVVDTIIKRFDHIDVLVNVAGGYRAGTPLHETPVDTWDFMMNLNARTVFLTSRAVIPHMIERERGKIISVGARAALKGTAQSGPYIASKMAVIRLTESMAAELKDKNINVNCILPGTIDTPDNRKDMPDADFDKWVTPDSMANVILFLASELAKDVNGAAVPVYGRG
ncbi:MAG: SDR family NAD(P)-dependent oxidoreductase [Chloroflexota bacterium]|jgi:NAD(P)-dependent dehydrogenase (short-subunit alcohol dehydrogenase family)